MGILYQKRSDIWLLIPNSDLFPIQLLNTQNRHNSTLMTPTQLTHGDPTILTIAIPIWHTHNHLINT